MLKNSAHRYLVVGLANTALDLVLFTVLAVAVGVPPVVANVISTVVVMTVSFFVNRAWVFRAESAGLRAYVGFVAVTLFSGLVLQSLVILGVIAVASGVAPDLPDELVEPGAKLVAMAVGMVSNFLGYRWVFSDRPAPAPAPDGTPAPVAPGEDGPR
ncbi:GtrA family protein [Nocardioides sp.]|uniref:GtrA family protein n=1 Tax=Nocardioides sp. TaxID=35761 RepID=UPI00272855CB|nr:GtrA family protein [Nocardioides sp.]MDO9456982.1 GtrA family protein [Nocardioides sp.]